MSRTVASLLDVPLFAAVCAALACGCALLIVAVRGAPARDGRKPDGRVTRWWRAARSPAAQARWIGALCVGVLALVVTRWPVAALGLGALVVAWPHLFGAARLERAQIAQLEALVTWTESLRDTIAAHASLEQAIPATTQNGPSLIRPQLIRLTGRIRARAPLESALRQLAAELDDASADRVVAALVLSVRRRGDKLADVLGGLTLAAREELDLRRQVSAGRAGMRRAVQIVVALTLAIAVFLILFGGEYLEPYGRPEGQLALVVVFALFAGAFAWMRQLAGLDPSPPFLERPGWQMPPEDRAVVSQLTGGTRGAMTDPMRRPG